MKWTIGFEHGFHYGFIWWQKKIGWNGGVSRVYHGKPYDRGIKSIYKQSWRFFVLLLTTHKIKICKSSTGTRKYNKTYLHCYCWGVNALTSNLFWRTRLDVVLYTKRASSQPDKCRHQSRVISLIIVGNRWLDWT